MKLKLQVVTHVIIEYIVTIIVILKIGDGNYVTIAK